ncbi:bis(5'-nucleosyl)-tetraphosphatase (symmetrical) YqeK [Thermosynechococcaceae cyanobacterium BACA0444]|uniref:bis(5'-nucleosyl)-tetraphosphatase (symmetrical) n=1 Tax=Pseudocalidococcus azoricus BACA0444 TaxID=2918990 RepID=A0AAE4FU34_9CYAN|nr:bis(5'-nucleosyl)-tetraphosphatase (symmetrical) YqeK [Pseudocalidococcus azoricus]MDS3862216.1 bis(5'-nucleosyl)-tetraphosphatase (symmetrical) YqeK [Pseudocalidococcus azoricus BACA0444]
MSVSSSRQVLDRQQVLAWLKHHVPAPRQQHILRVEEMAQALATQHHLNPETAAQAGLLHDLAKYFPPEKLLKLAEASRLEITDVDIADPHLLHADVSALVAQKEFQVTDAEILAAVADHTLGRPGMGLLSCVVFLADSLEPGRGNSPELDALRDLAKTDLHQAVWKTCDRTLAHLITHQRLIHPRMIATRNWALQLSPGPKNKSKS